MAIDDAEKRKAISGILIPLMPGVTPNGSMDSQWRQQSGWSYSGIASSAPPDSDSFWWYRHFVLGID